MLIVTTPEATPGPYGGQVGGEEIRKCKEVCATSDLQIGWGYAKQIEIVGGDRFVCGLGLVKIYSREKSSDESAVSEAGSTPVGGECPSRVARTTGRPGATLEALAVEVFARERDAAVRDPERAGGTLLAMTHDEGLPVREEVEWCGSGVKLREVTRLRRLADLRAGGGGKVNARAQ
jgi:hypothetical protein